MRSGGSMSLKKVVIVGAGCAGLSAAYTLKKLGVEVQVFEAGSIAGGRCRTIVEDGYEFIAGAGSTEPQWATTFQYLDELDLKDRIYSIQKQRFGMFRNGKVRTAFSGGSKWDTLKTLPENLLFFLTAMPRQTFTQVKKVNEELDKYMKLVDTKEQKFEALVEISNVSTEDFVLNYGGQEALEWHFHPFLATMVLGRPCEISIAHPMAIFSLMKGMCSMKGGLGSITDALYTQVKDSVRLNTHVKKIVIEKKKVTGVQIDSGFVAADLVICATDAFHARQLIPDLPNPMRKALETCKYSSTYYYQFGMQKPIVNTRQTPFHVVMIPPNADTILDFVSLGSYSEDKPVVIAPTRGWEDEKLNALSEEERRRLVITDIQKVCPAFPDEPVKTKVFRWDRAVNLEAPGQYAAIQDLLNNHYRDIEGLYLAGEYLFLFACTEGALKTGQQAAKLVADDITKANA